jgi:hypothetical protein
MNIAKKAALAVTVAGIAAGTSAGAAVADAGAGAKAVHSPGIGSGNVIQAPIHIPVNVTGNTVNVIGLHNPTYGNQSSNS